MTGKKTFFHEEGLFLFSGCVKLRKSKQNIRSLNILEENRLKLKELKRVLALSMAFTLAVPANVYAADVQVQTEDNTEMESEPLLLEDTQENTEEPENPVVPEAPQEQPETPEQPEVPETPEQPEVPENPGAAGSAGNTRNSGSAKGRNPGSSMSREQATGYRRGITMS